MKNEIDTEQAIRRAVHTVRVLADVDWQAVDAALVRLHEDRKVDAARARLEEPQKTEQGAEDSAALAEVVRQQVGHLVAALRDVAAAGASLAAFALLEEAVQAATAAFYAPEQLDAEAVHAVLVGVGQLTPEASGLYPAPRRLASDDEGDDQHDDGALAVNEPVPVVG